MKPTKTEESTTKKRKRIPVAYTTDTLDQHDSNQEKPNPNQEQHNQEQHDQSSSSRPKPKLWTSRR